MTPARQRGLTAAAALLDIATTLCLAQVMTGQALWSVVPLLAGAAVGLYLPPRPRARGVVLVASLLVAALSAGFALLVAAAVNIDVPHPTFFLACGIAFSTHRMILVQISRRVRRTPVRVIGHGSGTRQLERLIAADVGGLTRDAEAPVALRATAVARAPVGDEIVVPFRHGLPPDVIALPDGHRLFRFETCAEGLSGRVKRTIDLLLALLALPLLLPAAVFAALAVRMLSGPPAMHSQIRLTLEEKPFRIWKVRTMIPDAEPTGDPVWPRAQDDRATPLGSLLRRFWFDETPQILNVLKGDVSWVGPRPERPAFAQVLSESLPRYRQRHRVKGGLTGLAQIEGYVGNTSLRRRVAHDLAYIRRWSPWLDVKIVLGTLCQIARRKIRPTVDYAPGQPGRVP